MPHTFAQLEPVIERKVSSTRARQLRINHLRSGDMVKVNDRRPDHVFSRCGRTILQIPHTHTQTISQAYRVEESCLDQRLTKSASLKANCSNVICSASRYLQQYLSKLRRNSPERQNRLRHKWQANMVINKNMGFKIRSGHATDRLTRCDR